MGDAGHVSGITCRSCRRIYSGEQDFLHLGRKWRLQGVGVLAFSCVCGQDIVLKKREWQDLTPKADPNTKGDIGVFPALFHKHLPGLSAAAYKIKMAVQNPSTSNDQIASLFKGEPLIAARVLFMASAALDTAAVRNGRQSSAGGDVQSLSYAIGVLGRGALVNIITISDVASLSFKNCIYDKGHFLRDVMSAATAADFVATKYSGDIRAEDAYFAAAISLIGRAIQAICYPSRVNQLVSIMGSFKTPISWEEAEKMVLGLPPSAALGSIAAAVWDLSQDASMFGEPDIKYTASNVANLPGKLSKEDVLAFGRVLGAYSVTPHSAAEHLVINLSRLLSIGKQELAAMASAVSSVVKHRTEALNDDFVPPQGSAA